jgi:hypothetical protein
MRHFWVRTMLASLTIASACAEDPGGDIDGVATLTFRINKGGADVPCSDVEGIESIVVTAFATDGVTKRPGFPINADCHLGQVALLGLTEGDHILEAVARGPIVGEDDAVLFKARTALSLPGANPDLSLRPEVAWVTIDWMFENKGLDPCADEVAEVAVLLSASTGSNVTFNQRFQCTATPVALPLPLPVLNYTIRVDAYSFDDFQIYTTTQQRVLDRGDNTYTATLGPLGATIHLDWQFEIGELSIRACDDVQVQTSSVTISITDRDGNQTATVMVDCGVTRPYAFLGNRYQAGRNLIIEIEGEGEARFVGDLELRTSGQDHFPPPIVLEAVGTATASFTVDTATCASAQYDGFSAFAVKVDERNILQGVELGANERTVVFEDLPYGTYDVLIIQQDGTAPVCTRRGMGVIDGRQNAWMPIAL